MSFNTFVLREAYKRYQKLGDEFTDAEKLIDWKAFTPNNCWFVQQQHAIGRQAQL
jgi:hypothetical protein